MTSNTQTEHWSTDENDRATQTVMVTGATGYVGNRLMPLLRRSGYTVKGLARSPEKLNQTELHEIEIRQGDVLDLASLKQALKGIDTAFYLVHLMGGDGDFMERDRQAARNFIVAAEHCGVKRIIYLGGLGDVNDPDLSPHLRSRHEVGEILRQGSVEVIEFRAAVLVGAGSLSFEMIRNLTDRLPVMICPRWLSTATQPISIDDTLSYLVAALSLPTEGNRIIGIGGADVVTYGDMIREYARQRGLKRTLIPVPLLSPWLSSLWLSLVTPATAGVGRHLIEGLQNETTVRDPEPASRLPVKPIGMQEAIRIAIEEESGL
ncbi:3 beta-hydroxysteroid dehydrogenase/Delta 5--_4-isomerase [Polystyrenella longa]|uniref:3 beta-hydroxysteroid dehydrogenase/Delta 5-->4-isomerase n=1 Tax=Polystyrenella longa TaxID=2528007 RepID=A0A518CLE8_9PLAN|nr:NAD(P)H-binding protein [Polystyrenella longa]QDU80051.1 3 beta-hydroxysteroid dehydrogenase/Delta 5-->4-isomerase [Polystyrenella longa]